MNAYTARPVVDEILREMLGARGFVRSEIAERPDESGEAALYIDAHFGPGSSASDDRPMFEVIGTLRRRLLECGEERFPYLHYVFEDDEILVGDSSAAAE